MINIKGSPYRAVGDGITDDTRAIQRAIDAAGPGGNVFFPEGKYRITDSLLIDYYPGLAIDGENWEGVAVIMDANNKPIVKFIAQDTNAVTLSNLHLQYKTQQVKETNPNSSAIEYSGAANGESGFNNHIYTKIRITFATYGFNVNTTGIVPIWGFKWEDIILSKIGTTCFRIRSGQPIDRPMNTFANVKIIQDANANPSYAFDLQCEFLIDALDIGGWKNEILINDRGYNCVIRYVNVDGHSITKDFCSLFILQDGAYDVSAIDANIVAWKSSQHKLLQGNANSTLNARNIRVDTGAGAVQGSMSILGTFKKIVAAGLQKGSDVDPVEAYAGYLNDVWNVYSLDGLPPVIQDGYSLPAASGEYRGRMFYVQSKQNGDQLFVCTLETNNSYAWSKIDLDGTGDGGDGVSPHASTHITGGTDVIANADTTGKSGLMSSADKTKLDGIEAKANNYVHPATHPATMIVEDPSRRFVTDAEKAKWNIDGGSGGSTTIAQSVTSLPTASSANRGQLVLLLGATNVADMTYICKKLADNTYDWKQID